MSASSWQAVWLLAVEVAAVVGLTWLITWRLRSVVWQRTLWQAGLIALVGLLVVEFAALFPTPSPKETEAVAPVMEAKAEAGEVPPLVTEWPVAATELSIAPVPPLEIGPVVTEPVREVVEVKAEAGASSPTISAAQTKPESGFPLALAIVLGVWVVGTLVLAGRLLVGRFLLLRFCARSQSVYDVRLFDRVQGIAAKLGLKEGVQVLETERIQTPVVFGLFRLTIALPVGFAERFERRQQEAILAHELAHLAARDPLWYLLADALVSVLWWHPLVWVARARLQVTSELAADEACVLAKHGPETLAECLVTIAQEMHGQGALESIGIEGSGFRSRLGQRVERLLKLSAEAVSRPAVWRTRLVKVGMPVLLVAVLLVGSGWVRRDQSAPWSGLMSGAWNMMAGVLRVEEADIRRDPRPILMAAANANTAVIPDPALIPVPVSAKLSGKVKVQGQLPREAEVQIPENMKKHLITPITTRFYKVSSDWGLAYSVVYVKRGLEGKTIEAATEPVTIVAKGLQFQPYIAAAQTGQRIRFQMEDPVLHNLSFAPKNPKNKGWNKAMLPNTPVFETSIAHPERMARISSDTMPWAYVYLNVFEHPYFAVTDGEGRFEFAKPLPPGRYTLAVYHRQAGEAEMEVEVKGAEGKPVEFMLEVGGAGKQTLKLKAETEKKLDELVLPELFMDGLPLEVALQFLMKESQRLDPEKKGLQMEWRGIVPAHNNGKGGVLRDPLGAPLQPVRGREPGKVQELKDVTVMVNPVKKGLSFREVLKAVCEGAAVPLQYNIQNGVVVVTAKPNVRGTKKAEVEVQPQAETRLAMNGAPILVGKLELNEETEKKLDELILPELSIDGLPLAEALKYLMDESKRLDPQKKGLEFEQRQIVSGKVKIEVGADGNTIWADRGGKITNRVENVVVTVKPGRKGLSMRQALEAICSGASLPTRFTNQNGAVVVSVMLNEAGTKVAVNGAPILAKKAEGKPEMTATLEPLVSQIFTLKHAVPTEIVAAVGTAITDSRGKILADDRAKKLLVTVVKGDMGNVEDVIAKLDVSGGKIKGAVQATNTAFSYDKDGKLSKHEGDIKRLDRMREVERERLDRMVEAEERESRLDGIRFSKVSLKNVTLEEAVKRLISSTPFKGLRVELEGKMATTMGNIELGLVICNVEIEEGASLRQALDAVCKGAVYPLQYEYRGTKVVFQPKQPEVANADPAKGGKLEAVQQVKLEKAEISKLVSDAKQLYEQNRLGAAEDKLKEALKHDPTNSAAYYYLNLVQEVRYGDLARVRGTNGPQLLPNVTLPVRTNLYIRIGKVETNSFFKELEKKTGEKLDLKVEGDAGHYSYSSVNLHRLLQKYFAVAGLVCEVNGPDAGGTRVLFNPASGVLWVRGTTDEVELARKLVQPFLTETLPTPNPNVRTNTALTERQRNLVKLDQIVLKEVFFDDKPLSEVVMFLTEEARRLDPEQKGINFIINSNLAEQPGRSQVDSRGLTLTSVPNPNRGAVDLEKMRIKINPPLKNLRLVDALDAITKVATPPVDGVGLSFMVEDHAVVFRQRVVDLSQLFTRVYKLDTNKLMSLLEKETEGMVTPLRTNLTASGQASVLWTVPTNKAIGPGDKLSVMVRQYLGGQGVNLAAAEAGGVNTQIFFNDRTGVLMVRCTRQDLEIIETALENLGAIEKVMPTPNPLGAAMSAGTNEVSKLVQEAKQLYELRRLEEAEVKLREAMKLDPANSAAYYYMNLIQEARYSDLARKRDNIVFPGGLPKARAELATPNPYFRTNASQVVSKSRQRIESKLDQMVLKEVFFDGLPLAEVVRFLREESIKQDPEKVGINFVINSHLDGQPAGDGGKTLRDPLGVPAAPVVSPGPLELNMVLVTINPPLKNLTMREMLSAITNATAQVGKHGLDYKVEDFGVTFRQRAIDPPQLFTRIFKAETNAFVTGLEKRMGMKVDAVTLTADELDMITNHTAASSQDLRMYKIQKLTRALFLREGVNFKLKTAGGAETQVSFNDRTGVLMVRATLEDLDLIARLLEAMGAGATVEGKSLPVPKPAAESVTRFIKFDIAPYVRGLERLTGKKVDELAAAELAKLADPAESQNVTNRHHARWKQIFILSKEFLTSQGADVTSGSIMPLYPKEPEALEARWMVKTSAENLEVIQKGIEKILEAGKDAGAAVTREPRVVTAAGASKPVRATRPIANEVPQVLKQSFKLRHETPTNIVRVIRGAFTSTQSTAIADTPNNMLLVNAPEQDMKRVEEIIRKLDVAANEVTPRAVTQPLSVQEEADERITKVFKVDADSSMNGFREMMKTSGFASTNLQEMMREFIRKSGVNLSEGNTNGTVVFLNDRTGVLLARAKPTEMQIIESAIEVLNIIPPQVEIQANYLVIPEKVAEEMGLKWFANGLPPDMSKPVAAMQLASASSSNRFSIQIDAPQVPNHVSILSPEQARELLKRLDNADGVDRLSAPRVTTVNKRQAQISVMEAMTVVVGRTNRVVKGEAGKKDSEEPVFITEQFAMGPMLDVIPNVYPDGKSMRLDWVFSLTEFVGYEKPEKSGELPTPLARRRQVANQNVIQDGYTLVAGCGMADIKTEAKKGLFRSGREKTEKKMVLILMKVNLLDPAGNYVNRE